MSLIEIKPPELNVPPETLKFIQRILGPLAEAGDFLSEKIRFYRWQSSIKTMKRAEEIAKSHGIKPKQVPLKLLVPLLEKASLETEDSPLLERWATLLANASQDLSEIDFIFTDLLSSMSPTEVGLMEEFVSPDLTRRVLTGIESGKEVGSNEDNSVYAVVMGSQEAYFDSVWRAVAEIESATNGPVARDSMRDTIFEFSLRPGTGFVPSIINYTPSSRASDVESRTWGSNPPVLSKGSSYGILASLGLIAREVRTASTPKGLLEVQTFALTPLGYRFVRACRGDNLPKAT